MEILGKALENVRLEQSPEYVDITEQFFKSKDNSDGKVVKSDVFQLYEGTHALEVSNARLDTGLIPLSREEIEFDPAIPQDVDCVLSTMSRIIRSVMSWLNNSSLSVTVLSCRYVETIIVNYTEDPANGIKSCVFNTSIKYDTNSLDYKLVHLVLRGFIMGVLHFVSFGLQVGKSGVLFEEEDITTQSMDLLYLEGIPREQVLSCLEEATFYLSGKELEGEDPTKVQLMRAFIMLVNQLLEVTNVATEEIELYEGTQLELSFADRALNIISLLESNVELLDSLSEIPHSFSRLSQARLNNKTPPRDLYMISTKESNDLLIKLFSDLKECSKVTQAQSYYELQQITNCINLKRPLIHVLVRGILQLFLIRDDKSVMGSSSKTLLDLCLEDMKQLSCMDSALLKSEESIVLQRVSTFLGDVESAYYHVFSSITHNECRQRQNLNKAIVLFDTLQVSSEQLEGDIANEFKIDDKFPDTEQSQMPISSYVYFKKMTFMLEVVLKGFELDLYKPFEMYQMYWYGVYLCGVIQSHLERIKLINTTKLNAIANMNRKIKKLKGPKKIKAKEVYQYKLENLQPGLLEVSRVLEIQELEFSALKDLLESQRYYLITLNSLGVIKLPRNSLVSQDMLYSLRMKPWSSVGVPELPTYKAYSDSVANITPRTRKEQETLLSYAVHHAKESKTKYMGLIGLLQNDSENKLYLEDKSEWYKSYIKSSILVSLNASLLMKSIDQGTDFSSWTLTTDVSGHRYFPILKLSSQ